MIQIIWIRSYDRGDLIAWKSVSDNSQLRGEKLFVEQQFELWSSHGRLNCSGLLTSIDVTMMSYHPQPERGWRRSSYYRGQPSPEFWLWQVDTLSSKTSGTVISRSSLVVRVPHGALAALLGLS